MNTERRNIAVIGLGSFGAAVASELARFGNHVLGIDEDEARVAAMSGILHRTVIADARDYRAMEEVGLASYDVAVVGMASPLECSILAVMNAQGRGVREIWAKAATPTHARILERLGVDRILQPEQQFGSYVANLLHNPAVSDYIRLSKNAHIATVVLPKRFDGRNVAALPLEGKLELSLLGVLRNEHLQILSPEQKLQEGDALILIGPRESIRHFADRY